MSSYVLKEASPHWTVIAQSKEIDGRRPLAIRRFGQPWVLWRDDEKKVHGLIDVCPHRGASLALGKVIQGEIECPFHGFRFDGTGRCTKIPAHEVDRPIPKAMCGVSYPLREAHGFVWIWPSHEPVTDNLPWFDDLTPMPYSGFSQVWNAHRARCIENQLDFTHLPFVHRTTIGRGLGTEMDVHTHMEGEYLEGWVEGPAEVDVRIRFLAPGIWQLALSSSIRQFIAFVPIDDQQTLFYVRTYQSLVTVPGLRDVFGWVFNIGNRRILAQDRAVVESQRPRVAELKSGEMLLPSDGPIIAYRRWRKANAVGASEDLPIIE